MKRLLFYSIAIVIVIFMSSCSSTFYYSILNTKDERTEKVENGDFLLDTDSLWIAYCFKGESAPIQITVFNKTNKPLYIDWTRSVLIVDDLAISYLGQEIKIEGSQKHMAYPWDYNWKNDNILDILGQTKIESLSTLKMPKTISFIPPQTMVSEKTLNLQIGFENVDKKDYKRQLMANKNNEVNNIKRASFSESNTPLRFKSYLTIYEDDGKPMVFEQEFYISDLIKTNRIKPKALPKEFADRGDWFYIEKPANKSFINILLGTTIVASVVIADIHSDSDE